MTSNAESIQHVKINEDFPQMFIPILKKPTSLEYVPPPIINSIRTEKERDLCNIYSSLSIINTIYELFSVNCLNEEDTKSLYKEQMNLIKGIMISIDMKDGNDLIEFAQLANLDISYCKENIINEFREDPIILTNEQQIDFAETLSKANDILVVISSNKNPSCDEIKSELFILSSYLNKIIRYTKSINPPKTEEIKIMKYWMNVILDCTFGKKQINKMTADLKSVFLSVRYKNK